MPVLMECVRLGREVDEDDDDDAAGGGGSDDGIECGGEGSWSKSTTSEGPGAGISVVNACLSIVSWLQATMTDDAMYD